ncbi:MAG: leucine-rich repeat protein [Salinivirgaceae bacterium]|nr:leucine-rich repeat protein [Salinivirgaceae bacterium]
MRYIRKQGNWRRNRLYQTRHKKCSLKATFFIYNDNISFFILWLFIFTIYITIPNSVTKIDHNAFSFCKSLKQITVPNSVTSIGNFAFFECKSLQKIIIPKGSVRKYKKMLPKELWDKLYCLKKVV